MSKSLSVTQHSQVVCLVKLVLLIPATNAVLEKKCFSDTQNKDLPQDINDTNSLNNMMVVHIHKHLTDFVCQIAVITEAFYYQNLK